MGEVGLTGQGQGQDRDGSRGGCTGRHRAATLRAIGSGVLLGYGAVGVAVQLRLVPLLIAGLSGPADLLSAFRAPPSPAWLAPFQAHFDGLPWLAWGAWLVGLGLAMWGHSHPPATPDGSGVPATRQHGRGPTWAGTATALLMIAILLAVGGYGRMSQLWPQDYGLSRAPYDDEGVYAGASQLILQGIIPYRDYFFAHPPLAAISYAPAMAYHFTAWGSPTSFMMARYLSVAYSLVTLLFIFLIGLRLGGLWGAGLAGALWVLDGRVVEINRKVMLDGPMVLLACIGLAFYLWVRPAPDGREQSPRRSMLLLFIAGASACLSALTKIAGAACLLAILADMAWVWAGSRLSARRHEGSGAKVHGHGGRGLAAVLAGALVAALVVLGPFMVLAPSQMLRQVFFFQLLRPDDGLADAPARVADLTATLSNALTPLLAALGLGALSLQVWSGAHRTPAGEARAQAGPWVARTGAWRTVVLWALFSLLLFTYSRSFYSHYYIQLAAPLCLLGAGLSMWPRLIGMWVRVRRPAGLTQGGGWWGRLLLLAMSAAAMLVVALPALRLAVVQWNGINTRQCPQCEDHIFEIVGRYVNDAVPPGTAVLTTDEQFNFLAARPPSHNATGYLIDSYGHMIYLGLGLDRRDWGDLWGAVLRGEHSTDVYAIIWGATPQADFLDRAGRVPLVVVHDKGFARLTADTMAALEARNSIAERQARYIIFRKAGALRLLPEPNQSRLLTQRLDSSIICLRVPVCNQPPVPIRWLVHARVRVVCTG